MDVYLIYQVHKSKAGFSYDQDIIAAFRTKESAEQFAAERGLDMRDSSEYRYYEIRKSDVFDWVKEVSFLVEENRHGWPNRITVYGNKNVAKTLKEADILSRNPDYHIDHEVQFKQVALL